MEIADLLVILMLSTFIGLLLTGFPITFVLSGLAVVFTIVGYLAETAATEAMLNPAPPKTPGEEKGG